MVIATFNGLLGAWDSFMWRIYARSKWLLLAQLIRREEEYGSNWRSRSHHSKNIPQALRNMKNSILEEPLIHLIIWIRNDDLMNEEDDETEGSRRILPMKRIKDKYSIVISWYCFIFSWCVVHDRMFALMIVCMWWVSSSWCYTPLHCYLSRMKPLCWHIGLVHNLNDVMVEMEGI